MNDAFRRVAHRISILTGTPLAFSAALLVILVWAVTGPAFSFSDTWQLVINTGTTIVTFLMVFLIQNTQNRDSRALHMKLDELIIYTQGADNELVDAEDLSDAQMDHLEARYRQLAHILGKTGVPAPDGGAPKPPAPRRSPAARRASSQRGSGRDRAGG
jgi:low affinity Fe/Cu permease